MELPVVNKPDAKESVSNVRAEEGSKGSYAFVSLGCPKNLVDSERMLGLLQLDGYRMVQDPRGADFVIVNTCGFIEQARKESLGVIDEMIELKRAGEIRGVIVSGCLAERDKQTLLLDRPEIDHLVGVFARDEVTKVADRMVGALSEQRTVFRPAPSNPLSDRQRMRITPKHFAYLKISEGCDRLCTFCAIPNMRGKHFSKTIEEIVAEARELADDGVRELNIVAQDTTYYGIDRYGRPRLADLLEQLENVDGLEWIRLMYLYPMYFDDRLIETIAGSGKIIPYLDMPLQHINDKVLKRMKRLVSRQETKTLLNKLRRRIPDLVMRTTMIVGFPGETDEQFEELVEFVGEGHFQRLGVFPYAQEANTPASRMREQLPEEVKNERLERLMLQQRDCAFAWNERQTGRRFDTLIDAPVPGEANVWIGRTYADAPDIDGSVFVTADDSVSGALQPGKIVEVEIVASREYDLIAATVGPSR